MKRLGWAAAFVAAACLPAQSFSPYYNQGNVARWDFSYPFLDPGVFNHTTKAIRYFIGSETATVANRTAELNAIRASFAQWQAIPGTILKFEEAGLATTDVDIFLGDGRNLVFWAKTTTVNGGHDNIASLAGLTLVALEVDTNRILEADTALNAAVFSWTTDFNGPPSAARFVEGTMLHEIGHFLGLDHTPLGGATVIDGGPGVGPSAGLSSDEVAAAHFLYPAVGTLSQLGTISGTVRLNGAGIRGALVTAEAPNGIAVSATASDASGNYALPALPPGAYSLRVSPLDPDSKAPSESLFRGKDIAPDFGATVTAFKPVENVPATVTARGVATVNFAVPAGEPAFRVQQISKPSAFAAAPSPVRHAVGLTPGSTVYLGAAGVALPADAVFSISGDGLSIGPMIFEPSRFGAMNLLQAAVTVAADAAPGLRTLTVRRGADVAFANGYIEVMSQTPDYNFDGLNDRFQRQHFPLWTAPEAGPAADPDNDRFSNAFEALTGTNPTDPQSFKFLIERVDLVGPQARVTWKSDVGKQYQLFGKADVAGSAWEPIGGPITATSASAEQVDAGANGAAKFYKLKLLP